MSPKNMRLLAFLILLISIPGCFVAEGDMAHSIWMAAVVGGVLLLIFGILR